jgi:hypothetical protein
LRHIAQAAGNLARHPRVVCRGPEWAVLPKFRQNTSVHAAEMVSFRQFSQGMFARDLVSSFTRPQGDLLEKIVREIMALNKNNKKILSVR